MINQIRWGVFIGDDADASNLEAIKASNIHTFLDLRDLRIDEIQDDAAIEQVAKSVRDLNRLWATGKNILVYCHAGIDRSPFVVALWLSTYWDCDFQEAYDLVKEKRPQTIQHFEWYNAPLHKEGNVK